MYFCAESSVFARTWGMSSNDYYRITANTKRNNSKNAESLKRPTRAPYAAKKF